MNEWWNNIFYLKKIGYCVLQNDISFYRIEQILLFPITKLKSFTSYKCTFISLTSDSLLKKEGSTIGKKKKGIKKKNISTYEGEKKNQTRSKHK